MVDVSGERARIETYIDQPLGQITEAMPRRDPTKEIRVRPDAEGLVVAAEALQDGPAEHRARMDQRRPEQLAPADGHGADRPLYAATQRAPRIDEPRLRPGGGDGGMGVEKGDLSGQPRRNPDVVAAAQCDVFASDLRQTAIERARHSDVRLEIDEANARIAVAGDDLARAIGRPVVDDQQLEVGIGIAEPS